MNSQIIISSEPQALLNFFPLHTPCRNSLVGLIFIIITKGRATVEIDQCQYTLQKGTLLTILPSHLLLTKKHSKEFNCLSLAFTFDSVADFPYMIESCISETIEKTPVIQLNAVELKKLTTWHKLITSHYTSNTHPSYKEILCSLIFIFVAEINSIYLNKPIKLSATHNQKIAESFFKLLHQYFRTERSTIFYANKMCISLEQLSKIINKITGHTPPYWIADFTVREIKILLKSTTCTISQLSEQLNFPNSSFFARYFKRYTGITPQEYRAADITILYSS